MKSFIQTTTEKLDQAIYGYNPEEFMPVRVNGEIANWDAFAFYKLSKIREHVAETASLFVSNLVEIVQENRI